MNCVIGIDGIPYRYDTVMRIQPVDPDAGIIKISNEEYSTDFVLALSNSIMNKPSGFTWDNFNATANFHVIEPDGINSDARLEFKETVSITILGKKITDLLVSVELESVKIANLWLK